MRVLAGHDHGLLQRAVLPACHARWRRRGWILVTHAGGGTVAVATVAVPILTGLWSRPASVHAALALTISHVVVQGVKRSVLRARPVMPAHIACPDRFSFPSGHATAALAVGLSYALSFPVLAVPLVSAALLVGWSRVVLGVHYPGDVLAGQGIAVLTVLAL